MTRAIGTRRRRAGRVMIGVGVVGVFVAIVGTIVGWQFLGQINSSTGDSLTVTIDTIDSIDDSIDLVDGVLSSSADAIETTASTLDAVVSSFEESAGVIDSIQTLTDIVGPALGDAATNLRSLEGVADGVDSLLRGLSNIPFAPSYDSDNALAPAIGDLADDLAALPEEFATTSEEIDGFATSIDELTAEVDQLSLDISDVTAELDGRDALIRQYRSNIADARAVAVDTRDGLDDDIGLLRLLLVLGGLNFGVGQIVPFWVGRNLIREARSAAIEGDPLTVDAT